MLGRPALLSVISAVFLHAGIHTASAQTPEWALVIEEACGHHPQAPCLSELRKICHQHPTFHCYHSRKARMDGFRQVVLPDDDMQHDEW